MPSNSKFTKNSNGDTSVRVVSSTQGVADTDQDSVFCKDSSGNTAIRVVTAQESLPAEQPDSMFTKDTHGNTAIRTVGGGGGSAPVIDELNVTPSTSAQTITAPSGVDGYSPVNVSAVDASIDENITSGNIKSGVSILGVSGNVVELNGTTASVTPTTSAQTITPTAPNNGFTEVNVAAVTSAIDANIVAGNIKKDIQILGVTGSYEGQTPTGTKQITANGVYDVTNFASADVQVPTTAPEIYRVFRVNNGKIESSRTTPFLLLPSTATDIGDYCYAFAYHYTPDSVLSGLVDLSSLTTISGANACYYMFAYCTGITSVDLSSLTTLSGSNSCYGMFTGCTGITSIDLSSLTTISGNGACRAMFQGCIGLTSVDLSSLTTLSSSALQEMFQGCTGLTSVDLSGLTTLSGSNSCYGMFTGCTGITSIDLSSLTTISGNGACSNMFSSCTSLATVYIGGTTAINFGSSTNQFGNMFYGCTQNIDVYAPAASQTKIESLSGYPRFGATGTVTWHWRS